MQYETTSLRPNGFCPHCSSEGTWVMHGGACPRVAEIEYFPNGLVKRIRFHKQEREAFCIHGSGTSSIL